MNFSENVKIVKCYQGAADSVACDVINMENFLSGAFVVVHTGASDEDLTLSLYEATDVAAGTNAAVTTACPLYADTDIGTTSDVLVKQTSDYDFTIDTTTLKNQMWVIEIDPAILSDGYPCVYLADSGGHASNVCTILFLGEPRFKGETLVTAIA